MLILNSQTRKAGSDSGSPHHLGVRVLEMAQQLAQWSETSDGLTCTYLSGAHVAAAAHLETWMRAAGLAAHIDLLGNVVGRYASPGATKTLIVGSHYDTVANAGRFDGRLGILTGVVVAEQLQRTGKRLPFHLEVIGFAEEEGARFSLPYLGSNAIAGCFDEAALQRRDRNGVSLGEILQEKGVDLAGIRSLARRPETLCGYLEVHIEQGPVLLRENVPVGIVTSIAGAARYQLTVHGVTGHAGTVPMSLRHDAAAAAAEVILAVEQRCSAGVHLVGTVGQLSVPDGLINVIPGRCELSMDLRANDDATRDAAIQDILARVSQIAERRGVSTELREIGRQAAAPCSLRMQSALANAVGRAGIELVQLPSGAGHDAAVLSSITDIGMLFVRCGNGGISHSPLETVTAEDADIAARILLDVITHLP
jgi:beta-ureidopropionase / N-carbamoyl-L-amino-acid hydrolase